jgi:hypothetical protein
MPQLTQTLGPWLKPWDAKYSTVLGHQKDVIFELLDQLPPTRYSNIACHYSVANVLPFFWRGYDLNVQYTYRLTSLGDLDRIWSEMAVNIRTDVRKAEKQLEVREDLEIERFADVNELTFRRQRRSLPYSRDLVYRLDTVLASRGQRRIFFAVDARERVHGALYMVWDDESAYYLMGGSNPEFRNSGVSSLLIWRAIALAAKVTRAFDFEGSMVESIERFFRAFGAVQTPYYRLTRVTRGVRAALAVSRCFFGGHA